MEYVSLSTNTSLFVMPLITKIKAHIGLDRKIAHPMC